MTEIGAGGKRAEKLGLSVTRDARPSREPEAGRAALDVAFSGICGVTAVASFGVMAWMGFDRASLALAPVALAGAIGSSYFVWRRLRLQDRSEDFRQETRPPHAVGEPRRAPAPNLDGALQNFEEGALARHPQRIAAALGLATLGVNAQSDVMREQLQAAADTTAAHFAAQTKIIADRLGTEQGRLTEALDIYGESIVSRLNTASVSLAREFRDSGEALNKRVETAGANAVAAIARQADSSAAILARAVAEAEARLGEAARRIVAQIENVGAESGKKAVAVSDEVASRLSRSVSDLSIIVERTSREQIEATEARRRSLSETLVEDARTLGERADSASELVESRLRDAASAIEQKVASALARIEATLETRGVSLGAKLAELDHELETRWTSRSRGLVAELTAAASQAEAAAASASADVARVASSAAEAAHAAFVETAQDCARRWTTSADAAARDIGTAADRSTRALAANGEALSARLATFEATLAERGHIVIERLDGHTQALRASLDDARTTVETGGGGLVETINAASRALDGTLDDHRATLQQTFNLHRDSLGNHHSALEQTFDAHREMLATRAEADTANLRDLARTHAAEVAGALSQHSLSLTAGLAETLAQARLLADDGGQEAVRGLTKIAHGMVEGLVGELRALSDSLGSRGAALRDQILTRQGEMIDVIEGGVARTERRFAESLRTAAEAVDGCGRTVQQILAQATQGLKGSLTENAREAASLIDESGKALCKTVNRSARESATALAASVDSQRQSLEARVAGVVAEVEAARLKLAETINEAAQDADKRLRTRGAETVGVLRASAEAAARALDQGRELFVAATKDADRSLAARGAHTVDAFQTSVEAATLSLDNGREAFAAAAVDADKRLAARGADTIEAMQASIDAAARTLDQGRESFVDAVAETAHGVQAAFAARGQESQRALADETARALERLEAGRAAMAGAANEALTRFEADFSRRLAELNANMEGASDHLNRHVATPLREDIARIEAEGQELSSATRALAETIISTTTTHRERLHRAFAEEADAMTRMLDTNAATFRRELETVVSGADDVFLSRGVDVARAIASRVEDLRSLLGGDAMSVLKGLESSSEEVGRQIDAVSQRSLADFERKATGLINLLTRRGDDLLSSMTAAASESAHKVSQLSSEVDAHADRAGASLREIERKVGAMLSAVDRRSAEVSNDEHRRAPAPVHKPSYVLGDSAPAKAGSA